MNELGLIVLVIGVAIVALMYRRNTKVERFRNTCKEGDTCMFYFNEDRWHGRIAHRTGDTVMIINAFGQYLRSVKDIYPA